MQCARFYSGVSRGSCCGHPATSEAPAVRCSNSAHFISECNDAVAYTMCPFPGLLYLPQLSCPKNHTCVEVIDRAFLECPIKFET